VTHRDATEVVLLSTGGTISYSPGTGGATTSAFALDAHDLTEHLGTDPAIRVRPAPFSQIPSADMDVADVVRLARAVDDAATGAGGVVVSQGTDSLEETAYLLDLLVTADLPVVVTGAMRNSARPGADGPGNLDAALRVAASPLARGAGVLVVFGDEIHLARFVRKTHSSAPHAFTSWGIGPVGWVSEGRVRIPVVPRRRTQRVPVPEHAVVPPVALIRATIGMAPGSFRWPLDGPCEGTVIEAFGAGHLSAGSMPDVRELAQRMPVVFCSRTGAGETFTATADYPGSEASLLAAGLIPAGPIDGVKARAQLMLLLAAGYDREAIGSSFAATCW
jgi:L-asparaginase